MKLTKVIKLLMEHDAAHGIGKRTAQYSSQATYETKAYRLHKLDKGPAKTTTITSEEALSYYEKLNAMRMMEKAASNLYKAKMIRGFCHLYSGQEAVAMGIMAAKRAADSVITSYRCHAWCYMMGVSMAGVLGELTARVGGCSRGKGGSMHMYAPNFYGGNGIVGGQVPLGAGLALAHKYNGDGAVCFTLYGDGAANQGQLFEAFNLSKLKCLPVVFVCENNKYGMGTSADRSSASPDYYTRGDYIPGLWVDGMDVLTVREAARFAIEHCTSGKGPIVVEMETYRYFGHSMSDPGTSYRTREEVQAVRKARDPIAKFKEYILSSKLATADQLKEIDAKIDKEVDAAEKLSMTDTEADPGELAADVYYKSCEPTVRGAHPHAMLSHKEIMPRK